MGSKDHVAGTMGDAVVGVGRALVNELVEAGGGGFSVRGLLRDDLSDVMQEFVIDGAVIVEDVDDNALDAFDYIVV